MEYLHILREGIDQHYWARDHQLQVRAPRRIMHSVQDQFVGPSAKVSPEAVFESRTLTSGQGLPARS